MFITNQLIFVELIPLFAAVGFAVIGASAYGVYACQFIFFALPFVVVTNLSILVYNDKTLRVHQQPERKS